MNTRVVWGVTALGVSGAATVVFLTRRLAERSGATSSVDPAALWTAAATAENLRAVSEARWDRSLLRR